MFRSGEYRLNPALAALIMMLFGIPSIFGVNAEIQGTRRVIIQLVGVGFCGFSLVFAWIAAGMYVTRLSVRQWIFVMAASFVLTVAGVSGIAVLYSTQLTFHAAYFEAIAWLGFFGFLFDVRVATIKPPKKPAHSEAAAATA